MEYPPRYSIMNMIVFTIDMVAIIHMYMTNLVSPFVLASWKLKTKYKVYMLLTNLPMVPSYFPTIIS